MDPTTRLDAAYNAFVEAIKLASPTETIKFITRVSKQTLDAHYHTLVTKAQTWHVCFKRDPLKSQAQFAQELYEQLAAHEGPQATSNRKENLLKLARKIAGVKTKTSKIIVVSEPKHVGSPALLEELVGHMAGLTTYAIDYQEKPEIAFWDTLDGKPDASQVVKYPTNPLGWHLRKKLYKECITAEFAKVPRTVPSLDEYKTLLPTYIPIVRGSDRLCWRDAHDDTHDDDTRHVNDFWLQHGGRTLLGNVCAQVDMKRGDSQPSGRTRNSIYVLLVLDENIPDPMYRCQAYVGKALGGTLTRWFGATSSSHASNIRNVCNDTTEHSAQLVEVLLALLLIKYGTWVNHAMLFVVKSFDSAEGLFASERDVIQAFNATSGAFGLNLTGGNKAETDETKS